MTDPRADRVVLAARNNALWCRGVCAAHGLPTWLTPELWICDGPPPRFHSRATTLGPGPEVEAALRGVLAARPGLGGGIKDGFFTIDLADLGWSELFRAEWLWREPASDGPTVLDWQRVTATPDLAAWEAAWEGGPRPAGMPTQFPASLLDDPDIAFMAGRRDGAIVAGAALNRTGPVVGLSNAFGADPASDGGWADHATVAARVFPGMPLVGYERDADLVAAHRHGFTSIAPLRVWVPPEG